MKPRLRKYGRLWHCFWPVNLLQQTKHRARGVGFTPKRAWENWAMLMREHFIFMKEGRE